MSRPVDDDERELITASGQVECTECGHVIEDHRPACRLCSADSPCPARWTRQEIGAYRRRLGLPASW